ncbi:MAG: hypothetical protein V7724_06910 [Sediminicola sp.]
MKKRSLLFVESDKDISKVVVSLLNKYENWYCIEACDPIEAYRLSSIIKFHAVLIGRMAEEDEQDLIYTINETSPKTKFISWYGPSRNLEDKEIAIPSILSCKRLEFNFKTGLYQGLAS